MSNVSDQVVGEEAVRPVDPSRSAPAVLVAEAAHTQNGGIPSTSYPHHRSPSLSLPVRPVVPVLAAPEDQARTGSLDPTEDKRSSRPGRPSLTRSVVVVEVVGSTRTRHLAEGRRGGQDRSRTAAAHPQETLPSADKAQVEHPATSACPYGEGAAAGQEDPMVQRSHQRLAVTEA